MKTAAHIFASFLDVMTNSKLSFVDERVAVGPSCAIRLKTSKKCANRGYVKKFGNNSAFW